MPQETTKDRKDDKKDTNKKVGKVSAMGSFLEKDRKLGRNELIGKLGTHSLPITLDTGADVTVVPKEFVDDFLLIGDQVTVQSPSGHSIPMKTAAI